MGAEAFLVCFTIDGERATTDRFVNAEVTPGLLVVADEFLDDRDLFPIFGVESWVDPGGPVVGLVAEIIHEEFDTLVSGYISGEFMESLGVFGLEFWALGEILRDER